MLTALKDVLHDILPWVMYLSIFFVIVAAGIKRAQWGLLLLIVLIPLPNIWYKVHELPLGTETMDLVLLATMIGAHINNGGFERPPRAFLIGSYIFMMYVAVWNSSLRFHLPIPVTTANDVLADFKNYVEMLMLYFITYNALKTEKDQQTAVTLIAAVTLFIAVRELRNFDSGSSFNYAQRAAGPFWIVGLGANHFGAYIAYVGAFITGLLLVDNDWRRKWLYAGTVLALVYPLFDTYSRGAYAAVIAAMGVFGVLRKRLILVGIGVLAFTWTTVLPTAVVDRILMTETPAGQIEESAALRLVLWDRAQELFAQNPIFGIGYHGFAISVRIAGLNNTHNYYLQTACEQGVIGLLFLALLIFAAGSSGWRLYRTGASNFQRGMGLGFIGAVAAMAVSNVFGDRWSYFALGSYFWIFWGLVDRALTSSATVRAAASAVAPAAPAKAEAASRRANA